MSKNEIQWYAAKVRYQIEKKVRTYLDEKEIEHFIPFRDVVVEHNGRRLKKNRPVLPGFIFLKADKKTALAVPVESNLKMSFIRNPETGLLITIPEKQMRDFMFVLDFSEDAIRLENKDLRRGDRVRVIKGDFVGIEGELVRIKGHKRVVVRLEGLFSLATTYIPPSFLERIE
ncbi:MAG: UpxY family transcription antiterminator [Dysgonamonadaceae bacterium]|jgi:transcription antitermination factor NusG|nr:UpxY family transcription antiterminator [Dysgonamonadaceae bacterium]